MFAVCVVGLMALCQSDGLVENPDPKAHYPLRGAKLYLVGEGMEGFRSFDAMASLFDACASSEDSPGAWHAEAMRLTKAGDRVRFDSPTPVRVFRAYCHPDSFQQESRKCPGMRLTPDTFLYDVVVVRAEVLEGEHKGKQLLFDADDLRSMIPALKKSARDTIKRDPPKKREQ